MTQSQPYDGLTYRCPAGLVSVVSISHLGRTTHGSHIQQPTPSTGLVYPRERLGDDLGMARLEYGTVDPMIQVVSIS